MNQTIETLSRHTKVVNSDNKIVCAYCGSSKNIEEHHISYDPEITIYICCKCHKAQHPRNWKGRKCHKTEPSLVCTSCGKLVRTLCSVTGPNGFLCSICFKKKFGVSYPIFKKALEKSLDIKIVEEP